VRSSPTGRVVQREARVALSGGEVEVVDLAVERDGAARSPVVLLHEGLGSARLWRSFPEDLAARTGRRVIAWSRHGYGRSAPAALPRSPDYLHREAQVALAELLDRLAVPSPLLVGHSDGASIALIFAARAPVSGVVAIAPHVLVEERSLEGIRDARRRYRDGALRARLARHHDDPDATFWGWNDVWLSEGFRAWNIEACLPAVAAPILAVQAEDDPYGTLDQLDRIEAAVAGPVRRLVLVDGGHAPHVAHPGAVLDAVAEFAAGLP
jgi:pimeloyl-ACP methyl ester carboxylesterase